MEFRIIDDSTLKGEIASDILLDLPEWFGLPESTRKYIDEVKSMLFIAIYDKEYIGFCALKHETDEHINMHIVGIKKEFHNSGIGTKLISFIEAYMTEYNYKYLSVLTLSSKRSNKEYDITRRFYLKNGFKEFMELPTLWDSNNPAVLLLKQVKS